MGRGVEQSKINERNSHNKKEVTDHRQYRRRPQSGKKHSVGQKPPG